MLISNTKKDFSEYVFLPIKWEPIKTFCIQLATKSWILSFLCCTEFLYSTFVLGAATHKINRDWFLFYVELSFHGISRERGAGGREKSNQENDDNTPCNEFLPYFSVLPQVPLQQGIKKTVEYFRRELMRSKHSERNLHDPVEAGNLRKSLSNAVLTDVWWDSYSRFVWQLMKWWKCKASRTTLRWFILLFY